MSSLWEASARFPITQTLHKLYMKRASRRGGFTAGYVSEKLCDDMIQRVSPYLLRNAPVDILDLWPGCGLLSSKLNDLLRPRRHVMIEPNLKLYGPVLQELAESKPCYKFASGEVYGANWAPIYEKYLPEQIRPVPEFGGTLPKNDTLLVLARPPGTDSKQNHYTPARWWASVMEDCMNQTGLHMYGSVRILVGLNTHELQVVLPRSIHERRRPAMLTENVAFHTFELASVYEPEPWYTLKTWKSIERNKQRVAERTAEKGVITPPGREPPALQMAPQSPASRNKVPYNPRARTEAHYRYEKAIRKSEELSKTKSDDPTPKTKSKVHIEARTARHALNFDNLCSFTREDISNDLSAIDDCVRKLSRAAADPKMTADELKKLDQEIETRKAAATQKQAESHYRVSRGWDRFLDDARIEACSNKLDDSVLLWDRRPFEPLLIEEDEVFPRLPETTLYFEADEHAVLARKLNKFAQKDRQPLMQLFQAMTLSFGSGNQISIAELADRLFPGRAANDIVKDIPSLAKYAGKRLKPGCGPMPLADSTLDPTECFQENIDYDLSDARVITLPVDVFWDVLLEFHKMGLDYTPIQLNRLLGGNFDCVSDWRLPSRSRN
ncbi:hypothetical protein N7520_003851, partial [Penicillium odoratum]|uniref:uncharacterized protein n=1 Tax=Penicillium odoratum TaxID=1167516 RepID=UPI002548908E